VTDQPADEPADEPADAGAGDRAGDRAGEPAGEEAGEGAPPPGALPPAFYASGRLLARPRLRDAWTLLHPPYTLWHLSYVVIGACLDAPVDATRLIATLLAFLLAVGVGAHALDELHGRPLRTTLPTPALVAASILGIGGAGLIGVAGVARVGGALVVFIVVGIVLAVGYNLELFGGRLHTDTMFALSWGAFPVLTGYYAQHERLTVTAGAAAVFAYFLSRAQRHLSTPARALRRRTRAVHGTLVHADGTTTALDRAHLLVPLERALRSLTWATVALAVALALARLRA
jgi:hypothetical protein